MSNRNKYDFDLDFNNPILAALVEQIRPGSVILEFGPAMGRLTRYLKNEMNCLVYIVELDETAYEAAVQYAEKGILGNIESVQWEKEFSGIEFDYIIFGDVLEHLGNPKTTLERTFGLLKDDGQVLGTIPNISYAGVVLELMQDKFRYRDIGILDKTHLRFFTRENIEIMLKESNYVPVILKGFSNYVSHSEFSENLGNLPVGIEEFLQDLPWGKYYQYLFVAIKEEFYSKNKRIIKKDIETAGADNIEYPSYLYYDNGQGFNEGQKLSSVMTPADGGSVTFRFANAENIQMLRWDPVFSKNIQCSNVYLLNGINIIKPSSSNSERHLDGTDYFLDGSAQYIFDMENSNISTVTIYFNISVIYDIGTNIKLEKELFRKIREKTAQFEKLNQETEENRLTIDRLRHESEANLLTAESYKSEADTNRLTADNLKQESEEYERERIVLINKNKSLKNTVFKSAEAIHQNATEAHQIVTALQQDVAALHGEIASLQNRLAQEMAELSAVLSTKSWRIMWPLRAFYTVMKKNRLARFLYFKIKKPMIPPAPPVMQIPAVVTEEQEKVNEPLVLTPLLSNKEKPSSVEETVSFIIPTYNGGTDFKRLMSLLKAQKGFRKIEIIIVDSGSTDETPEIAEYLGARLIRITQEEFSHSYSRNLGAESAQGEYLFFITQDAMPTGRWWARNIMEPLITGKAVAASCIEQAKPNAELYYRVASFGHNSFMELFGSDRIGEMPQQLTYVSLRKNAQLSNVTCAVCADVFYKYGFRGEYGEDLDFGLRVIKDGYNLAFLSTEKVIHSHDRSILYFFKRAIIDSVFFLRLFPDMPKVEFEKNALIEYLAQGYRQIMKLQMMSFREGDVPAYLFKIQTEMQLLALRENDIDVQLDEKLSEFDKAISALWKELPDIDETDNNMITELINYFNYSVMPYLMQGNAVVAQRDADDLIDCFYKYYAVAAGDAIGSYVARNSMPDEIHSFAKKYMNGV